MKTILKFLVAIFFITVLSFATEKKVGKLKECKLPCTVTVSFKNDGSTTVSAVDLYDDDEHNGYTSIASGNGIFNSTFTNSTTLTLCIRVGTSHPAGRVKFYGPGGVLLSCSNIPANSNGTICYDVISAACPGDYYFQWAEVTCPN